MVKRLKRILSLALAMVMVFGMVPVNAFAIETEVPEVDEAVAAVQAMMDALPTSVTTEEEATALEARILAVDEAMAELTYEQLGKLDYTNYTAATTALSNFAGEDYSQEQFATVTWINAGGSGTADDPIVLGIKDESTISYADVYSILTSVYGSEPAYEKYTYEYGGDFRINATTDDKDLYSWPLNTDGATKITSGGSGNITTGNTVFFVWTCTNIKTNSGWITTYEAEYGSLKRIQFKTYYEPTVTVTGKDGVTADYEVGTKVYYDGSFSFTLPPMGEDNWTATVEGLADPVSLNKDTATSVTVPNITSVDKAAISVELKKATIYDVTIETINGGYAKAEASVSAASGINGKEIVVTATPKDKTDDTYYFVEKIEVNGKRINGNAFAIDGEHTHVVVTFNAYSLSASNTENVAVDFNGYYANDNTKIPAADLNKLKEAIFNAMGVAYSAGTITWENVSIQYRPHNNRSWIGGGDEKYADNAVPLNASAPSDGVEGLVWNDYTSFGGRMADENARELIVVSYQVAEGITLSVTAEIALEELRNTATIAKKENAPADENIILPLNEIPSDWSSYLSSYFDFKVVVDDITGTAADESNPSADAAGVKHYNVSVTEDTFPDEGETETFNYEITVDAGTNNLASTTYTGTLKITNPTYDLKITVEDNANANIGVYTDEACTNPATLDANLDHGETVTKDYWIKATPVGEGVYISSITLNGVALDNVEYDTLTGTATVKLSEGATELATYAIAVTTGIRTISATAKEGFEVTYTGEVDELFLENVYNAIALTVPQGFDVQYGDITITPPDTIVTGSNGTAADNIFTITWNETDQYPEVSCTVTVPVTRSRSQVEISGTAQAQTIELETLPTLDELKAAVEAAVSGLSVPNGAEALVYTADANDLQNVLDSIKQGDTLYVTVTATSGENDIYTANCTTVEVPVYGVVKNTAVTITVGNGGTVSKTSGTYEAGTYEVVVTPNANYYWDTITGLDGIAEVVKPTGTFTVGNGDGLELGVIPTYSVEITFALLTIPVTENDLVIPYDVLADDASDEYINGVKDDILTEIVSGYTSADIDKYTVKFNTTIGYKELDEDFIWNNGHFVEFAAGVGVKNDGTYGVQETESIRIYLKETGKYPEVMIAETITLVDSRTPLTAEQKTYTLEDPVDLNDSPVLEDIVKDAIVNGGVLVADDLGDVTASSTNENPSWGEFKSWTYTVDFKGNENYRPTTEITVTLTNVTKTADDCYVQGTVSNGSLYVNGTQVTTDEPKVTVTGLSQVSVAIRPENGWYVDSITVSGDNGKTHTFSADKISYTTESSGIRSYRQAAVSFKADGDYGEVTYTVTAELKQSSLLLNRDQTIVYCLDKDGKDVLKGKVFEAVYNNESIPALTVNDVKVEYLNITWRDVTRDPSINLGDLTHKFGEKGSETVKVTITNEALVNKYGALEAQVLLNVFDSCYTNTFAFVVKNAEGETVENSEIGIAFDPEKRNFMGTDLYKEGTETTVTVTPAGKILETLDRLIQGNYAETSTYIKSITVTAVDKDGKNVDVAYSLSRGTASLLQGGLYNASVSFTTGKSLSYTITVEYGELELQQQSFSETPVLEMYQGATAKYAAKVPSADDFIDLILGEAYAEKFLGTYGGAFKVEYAKQHSTEWEEVTDDALLTLADNTTIQIRITWKAVDGDKTYYPVAVKQNVMLRDQRTETSIAGSIPTDAVEYVDQTKLIAALKKAMGLGVMADSEALTDADYAVTYTITGDDENGWFADVTVTYYGTAESADSNGYQPSSKTFESVPIQDIPDNATVKITIGNASAAVTNNNGDPMSMAPDTLIYTVIGNSEYTFSFKPLADYAIESVTINGVKQEITHKDQKVSFTLTLTEKEHYEIVVETVDSVFVLEDERVYDFAYGVMDPVNQDIVDAAISAPVADKIDYSKVKVEYLAREEGAVPIEIPAFELPLIGQVNLGTIDVPVGELWLDPNATVKEYDLKALTAELAGEVLEKISAGELSISNVSSYLADKLKNLTIGAHVFGSSGHDSVETIRISYEDEKYLMAEVETDVKINDYRTPTELTASDCEVTYGYSLEQLIAASGAQVSAEGTVVEGLRIETKNLYLHAGTEAQQVKLYFAGDVTYRPCELTINVVVNKADCAIDYDSQFITFGDAYDFTLKVSPSVMPDGTIPSIDRVEFMIGLDMHTLLDVDIEDKTVGLDQAITYIQLRLPESIRNIPAVGDLLQGEFTLGEFVDMITGLSGILGIDENSVGILSDVVEAITGITDNMEIKVIVKDEDFEPDNIGVYIAGAVTVDADFNTAYTADYLIIAPKTIEATLAWDYTDDNGVMTLPVYQEIFAKLMGAHVVENEETGMTGETLATANGHIKYLILGVNDETSEFLTTDIYGNIKANIWTSNGAITDNGAYVQIAYMLNWGNEIYYAMPIVRSFIIVPQTVDVQLVGATGEPNDELLKTFNNEPQGFSVKITNAAGELIYSSHYQDAVNNLSEYAQLKITYVGVQTNGKIYNATVAPTHAGAYAVAVTFADYDKDGNLLFAGADMGLLVIEPAQSTIDVANKVVAVDPNRSYDLEETLVTVGSTVPGLKPDTTIISAQIASDGQFSENGWESVSGNINIDFPKWMDELLVEHVPDLADGMTVAELKETLTGKLPEITAKLTELGATEEIINSLNNLVGSITDLLDQMPEDATLTFNDNVAAQNVGAYAVVGIVTDSDHYPVIDAGILVITPDVELVHLKWNHQDQNKIWTRELLQHVDLWATAFDDEEYTAENGEATAKITYQFIGIDKTGELIVMSTTNADELPNGAYIELAYIELEVDGKMHISDLIARDLVIVPGAADVIFIDDTGAENNDRIFTFDNTEKTMDVKVAINGEEIEPAVGTLSFTYAGVQTNGKEYYSTTAPKHAGVYTVTAVYTDNTDGGSLAHMGIAVGIMAIEPAESAMDIADNTVVYDGGKHTTAITATGSGVTEPDYTMISGYVRVDSDIDTLGVDAFTGNVNIDFPAWLDEVLTSAEAFNEGIDPAYLIDFIVSYRGELTALIPADELLALGMTQEQIDSYTAKLNDYIDELLRVLTELPQDVSLTFTDDIAYSEPGYYFYYGIVTDSDHYPSTDTGILVIEKKPIIFDLLDTDKVWNGNEQFVDENNPNSADYFAIIANREAREVNILVDADVMYLIEKVEQILGKEIPDTMDIAELRTNGDVQAIIDALNTLIAEAANLELPDYAQTILAAMKEEMASLPNEGTITMNGTLPTEIGEYEIYAVSYSEYFTTEVSEAVLKIHPVTVEVILDDQTKVYGEDDPTLTYTVNYYDHEGNRLADAGIAEVTVTREAGEDVDEYAITASVSLIDDKHYVLPVKPENAVFTITPAQITSVEVSGEYIYIGEEQVAEVIVKCGETVLVEGVDYEVISGDRGVDSGEYRAEIQGIGNYAGTAFADWSIARAEIVVEVDDKTMKLDEQIPELTFTVNEQASTGKVAKEKLTVILTTQPAQNNAGQYVPGEYVISGTGVETDNWIITVNPGKLTVEMGDYICWNVLTGTYYDDVTDALDAAIGSGATIQMLKDATDAVNDKNEVVIIVYNGLTLDLNGHYVQTANLLSYGVVMDRKGDGAADEAVAGDTDSAVADDDIVTGGIMIGIDDWAKLQPENAGYMPIYDTNTGSYKFYEGQIESRSVKADGVDAVKFRFRLNYTNHEAFKVLANTDDSGFDVVLHMDWTGISGFGITYIMPVSVVRDHAQLQYDDFGYVMYARVYGLTGLEDGGYVKAQPTVVSKTEMVSSSTVLEYNVP